MTTKIPQKLTGVSETLLMTLYVRARESRRADGMLKDDKAVEIVERLDCDLSRLRLQRHDEVAVILRMRKFDGYARDFLRRNPKSVIVHIGCGLDTRFERVDNGQVEWFDLDVAPVMDLRQKLMDTDDPRYHPLAASAFETGWFEEVSRCKPLPYFEEAQVKSLMLDLCERFPGAELVCDAHTPFVIWADNLHLALAKVEARLHWSLKRGSDMENWRSGIRLLDEWNYYDDDEINLKAFRWVRLFPRLAKSSGVFHYQLGERP